MSFVAHFRGDLEKSWQRVCEYVQSGASGRETDQAAMQARSEEFRISRDLISAEETERWLDERGLSLDDFSDFLIREEVSASGSLSLDRQVEEYTFAPADLRELLRIDLLFTGDFDRLAMALAWRMAAREGESDALSAKAIESERARFSERSGLGGEGWISGCSGLGETLFRSTKCWNWKPSSEANAKSFLASVRESECCTPCECL